MLEITCPKVTPPLVGHGCFLLRTMPTPESLWR